MSASRVPKRASLELQHGLRKVKPRYYDALLSSPPPPSLVRLPQVRPASDLPTKTSTKRLQPAPIVWETEDRVRLQFYKDHPWERARAKIVTELDMVGAGWKGKARGLDWTELKQRSRNPTPDE
jgi:small subunit ribosomal protein S23